MRSVITFVKETIRKERLALLMALLVGVIYVAPHVLFIMSLGNGYAGIPMLETQNEDYYLTRIREIIDGHYSTGSFMFYEYKDAPPLTPPTLEFFYALPTLLFGISYVATAIASRFFLPAILFLLVYILISRLTSRRELLAHKLNAIAGALFVTLGYDLINYRQILRFFSGSEDLAGSFLVWSRLIHPIGGAILLCAFLLCLWALVLRTEKRARVICGGAACMAFMLTSYFFSWGLALSIWGMLLLVYLCKREWRVVTDLLLLMGGAFILAIPYFVSMWYATKSPWYADSLLRGGLFLTHYPMWNKLLLAVLALYAVLVWGMPLYPSFFKGGVRRTEDFEKSLPAEDGGTPFTKGRIPSFSRILSLRKAYSRRLGELKMENWQWFLFSIIFGSLWVYVQQVVTGRTIWPYHFAQYTIVLGIIVSSVLCYRFVWSPPSFMSAKLQSGLRSLRLFHRVWWAGSIAILSISFLYGIGVQTIVYRHAFPNDKAMQAYAPLVRFLNTQTECVVFTNKLPEGRNWNYFLTAFTPCDVYAESGVSLLMPYTRVYHSYLSTLRLRGVAGDEIEGYLTAHPDEVREYLFGNWQGLYGVRNFPDVTDPELAERRAKLPEAYREFLKLDFKTELKKYRLDYILSIGPLTPKVLRELPGTTLLFTLEDMYLYTFNL